MSLHRFKEIPPSPFRTRHWRDLRYDMALDRFMRAKVAGWEPKLPPTGRPFDFRRHARSGPR